MPTYTERAVTCPLLGGEIVPAALHRLALIFPGPLTNRYTITTRPAPVIDVGITIYPAAAALTIQQDWHGDAAQRAWFGISAVADQTIVIGEVMR